MNWFFGLSIVLVVIFIYNNYYNRKKRIKLKQTLIENWGKPKTTTYFNFFVIGRYFEHSNLKKDAFHIISEKVKVDLDIDDVFKFIDRTSSKIGQQYLYFKLRTIGSIENLLKFNSLTILFENNKFVRLNCQLQLSKLNGNSSYYFEELINGKQIEKPKSISTIYILSISALITIGLTFIYPFFSLLLIPIFMMNLFFHYKNKGNINYYLDGVSQLSKCLKVCKNLAEIPEIKLQNFDLSFIKKVSSIQLKSEFIGFDNYLKNEYAFIFWFPIELIKILFNLEYIIFFSFIDSITKEKGSLNNMFHFIGEIDAAISVASIKSSGKTICNPNFKLKKQLKVKEIYHPLINNCIPNNINLLDKSMLLTGSNMSGKTTFIRTIAVNSILAQTLYICFAKEFSSPFLKVHSSIRITDDLLDDTSYYLKEVLTIKELIIGSEDSEPCLFVLDEIFKGTNTIERISGGKAILSYLNKKNNIVFVSTHDIELTGLLEQEDYQLFHFCEQIEKDQLFFDHRLKEGKLTTRNAIKILEIYNYPSKIIKDARHIESNYF